MLDQELEKETKGWLGRIEEELKGVSGDEYIMKNIHAYVSDSKHFLERNDLIRAFEAVIWAWAYLEIGKEQKLVKRSGI